MQKIKQQQLMGVTLSQIQKICIYFLLKVGSIVLVAELIKLALLNEY